MRKSLYTGVMAGVLGIGLSAPPSHAEIRISDNLSLEGFIDMSSVLTANGGTSLSASLDQLELDFLFKFTENLSARADINSLGGGAVELEQAFLTWSVGPTALKLGKFLSVSGFEDAEPTGLYQYSYSKSCDGTLEDIGPGCAYGGYQNGVGLSYTTDLFALYGAVLASVWNHADVDLKNPGFEAQLALTPLEGVTVKAAYLFEKGLSSLRTLYPVTGGTADPGEAIEVETDGTDQSLVNLWASWETGPVTLAGEFNYLMDWGAANEQGYGFLAMANYAITDKLGVTARFSGVQTDSIDLNTEFTFSPGYAINDNWFALAEIRRDIQDKVTTFAVESIISF